MQQLGALEVKAWLDAAASGVRPAPVLLDVRETWEYELCHLPGSIPMPMNSVPTRLAELDRERAMIVICHHGGRSLQVASFLEQQGFANLSNLHGGVAAWARQVDPAMPTY